MKERSFQTKLDALRVTVRYSYTPYEPSQEPDDENEGRKADVKITSVLSENGQDLTDTLRDTEMHHLRKKCFSNVAKG